MAVDVHPERHHDGHGVCLSYVYELRGRLVTTKKDETYEQPFRWWITAPDHSSAIIGASVHARRAHKAQLALDFLHLKRWKRGASVRLLA